MSPKRVLFLGLFASVPLGFEAFAAEETVATAVYSKIGNGYKREKAKNGTFKPEYYALSNGGRIANTTTDLTVDRVPYAEVAEIASKLLAQQSYRYAQTKEQAKLLLVLNWGSTLTPNWDRKNANIALAQAELQNLERTKQDLASALKGPGAPPVSYPGEDRVANTANGFGRSIQFAMNEEAAVGNALGSLQNSIDSSLTDDRVRDELNKANARVLGYMDDLAVANDARYAGGGDRYTDLISEVEEARYYIMISAYDFVELTKTGKKKLLWQTRVSVRSPGNSFDSTVAAMLKSASKYFGQNSGRLIRGEESKGTVEMGDVKFLGEAKGAAAAETKSEPAKLEAK